MGVEMQDERVVRMAVAVAQAGQAVEVVPVVVRGGRPPGWRGRGGWLWTSRRRDRCRRRRA